MKEELVQFGNLFVMLRLFTVLWLVAFFLISFLLDGDVWQWMLHALKNLFVLESHTSPYKTPILLGMFGVL
jgi:hypothetical protein